MNLFLVFRRFLIVVLMNKVLTFVSASVDLAEDAILTTPGLIFKYGFPVETHNVTTKDGYILEIHRIPKPGKQPVILQHGMLDSSATFVLMGPEKGLAYILWEQGYDIWLSNSRGNRYSRRHVNLSEYDDRFWKFSWHEMGVYDIPALLDYIVRISGFEKIHFIGHSQGTTSFFVMGSERPEYNSKVLLMQALAPVAYLTHCKSPFRSVLLRFLDTMSFASSAVGFYEILPNSKMITDFSQRACREQSRAVPLCSNILFLVAGYNEEELNMTMLPVIYGHIPAGSSLLQLIHYGQNMRAEKFRQYDHGGISNLLRYQRLEPPNYNLTRVTAPIILHYAQNDFFSVPEDVDLLASQLPNVLTKRMILLDKFNHIDFLWGVSVKDVLYKDIIANMKKIDGT